MEEKDKIIGKLAQEDVETSNNLLNNNNNNNKYFYVVLHLVDSNYCSNTVVQHVRNIT